jgi:biotin transport system substrate-specific component
MENKTEKQQNGRGRYAFTAKRVCYAAVAVALISVCSFIAVPFGGVPYTLQIFALCLIALLLGVRLSLAAVAAYLLLGFCGVPVFAGFTGGVEKLLSPTGGYLLATLPFVAIVGAFRNGSFLGQALGALVALALTYLLGTLYFSVLYTGFTGGGIWTAIVTCVLPYILADIAKLLLAVWLSERLKKYISIEKHVK